MFEKIKYYYQSEPQLWSKNKVRDAVAKGKITEDEYELITGEKY